MARILKTYRLWSAYPHEQIWLDTTTKLAFRFNVFTTSVASIQEKIEASSYFSEHGNIDGKISLESTSEKPPVPVQHPKYSGKKVKTTREVIGTREHTAEMQPKEDT